MAGVRLRTEVTDPGRAALATLWRLAWCQGFIAGSNSRAVVRSSLRFALGVITGMLLTLSWAFAQEIPPGAQKHKKELTKQARQVWGVDAPISSLAAQIHQESKWDENARSPVGAAGLTQFMSATAHDLADSYPELRPVNVFSPKWALRAQSLYMRELWDQVGPVRNDCERAAYTLAAYNGGLRWVEKRRAISPYPDRCLNASCDINPGIKPSNQRENREYSRRILLELTPLYYQALWGPGWCLNYSRGR